MGGDRANEFILVPAQVGIASDPQISRTGREQVRRIQHRQIAVALRVVGHLRQQADAQPELHVGLDHIRVDGGQRHIQLQTMVGKYAVDHAAAGKRKVVGHNRVTGDFFQRQRRILQQGVSKRHDQATVPLIAWQSDQFLVVADRLGRQADIRLAADHLLGYLGRIALMDAEMHLGECLHEGLDRRREPIARLSMGRGDDQVAGILMTELVAHAADILHLVQHALRHLQDGRARLGHADQALAVALENLQAELFFQQLDLLADAGLGGMQILCRGGYIEPLPGHLSDVAQLVQFH